MFKNNQNGDKEIKPLSLQLLFLRNYPIGDMSLCQDFYGTELKYGPFALYY